MATVGGVVARWSDWVLVWCVLVRCRYVLSFPGLWSLTKRAAKEKPTQKTYVFPGPNAPDGDGLEMRKIAGEVRNGGTQWWQL